MDNDALNASFSEDDISDKTTCASSENGKMSRRKAFLMQAVLLLATIGVVSVGATLEKDVPDGLCDGFWAFTLVVPATGFMVSLFNWFFVRFYKSRKSFSDASLGITVGIPFCTFMWTCFHYEIVSFSVGGIKLFFALLFSGYGVFLFGGGVLLIMFFSLLSRILSKKFAIMLGKE